MALFITFEGVEGSGKSFQARALYRKLSGLAIPALLTHEPGGTPPGERISRLLKWVQDTDISPLTELLLFNASRAQLVDEVIRPALESGQVVICDRFTDSTIAYQSYGRGLNLDTVRKTNNTATAGLKPDITILLDISVEAGFARKKDDKYDRFEREDIIFHGKVEAGYQALAKSEPERWLVIDGGKSKEKIKKIIWQRVSQRLSSHMDKT